MAQGHISRTAASAHEYIDAVFEFLSISNRKPRVSGALMDRVSQCAVCLSWPSHPVCAPCRARFMPVQRRCRKCALLMPADLSGGTRQLPLDCVRCERNPPPVDATHVAVSYAFPWSGLIAQYKFSSQTGWAAGFAALMLEHKAIADCLKGLTADDVVLPLPLSRQRLQTRGFNQSWLLAQSLAAQSGTPARLDASLLLRIRDTAPQSSLPKSGRLTNVRGAFAVDPLNAGSLAGRHVVLVDDVMTSGASINAAALALQTARAARVTVLVLARTEA